MAYEEMKTTHSQCYGGSRNFLGHRITCKTSAPSDVPPFRPCDKENGKTRDLKGTLLSRGLAPSSSGGSTAGALSHQPGLMRVGWELKLKLMGHTCLIGFSAPIISSQRGCLLFIQDEKRLENKELLFPLFQAFRGIAVKRTAILRANLITQCVLPQRNNLALHYLLSTVL